MCELSAINAQFSTSNDITTLQIAQLFTRVVTCDFVGGNMVIP